MGQVIPPPAPKGNKRAVKLKDPDVRQEAYRQFCEHIAAGWPIESFFFDHPKQSVCWRTMLRYINENPAEFQPILMEKARAARYKRWMWEGMKLMMGKYKGGSPVVWQTIMRNIFKDVGWDREPLTQDNKSHVEQLAKSIRHEAFTKPEEGDCELEQAN